MAKNIATCFTSSFLIVYSISYHGGTWSKQNLFQWIPNTFFCLSPLLPSKCWQIIKIKTTEKNPDNWKVQITEVWLIKVDCTINYSTLFDGNSLIYFFSGKPHAWGYSSSISPLQVFTVTIFCFVWRGHSGRWEEMVNKMFNYVASLYLLSSFLVRCHPIIGN